MSLVMLEVKPLDDTINLDDVAKKIFAEIIQDGLFWKTEYKKEPVAFGIFKLIIGFSLEDEPSIIRCAQDVATGGVVHLVIDATGILHDARFAPERSWREIDPAHMAHSFALNATGPALLLKHFLPLLPREGKAVFATLSARVGSIGDNGLGGWYAYRASKAALNQLVRTAAVELRRRKPDAICLSLHPGTVETGLSAPFARGGLDVQTPDLAAQRLVEVINGLAPADNGSFRDHRGDTIPW